MKINNKHRLLTLDIKDLYVNIQIKETINITKTQLLMHNDKHTTNQIIMLLETILGQNYFTFQNQIYQPDKGVAMGSPVSGTVAKIFLQLEKNHIKHLTDSKHQIFYARYVDHIIYDSTLTSPTSIQHYMDTIHGNIKLNPTHETNEKVNFLDLSVTRKPTSLKLDIYCKPTATDTTINFHSNHPLEHKLTAYRFFINRMLSLPLNEVRHKEWISIKQTARNNNIPVHLLTNFSRNIQKKLNQTPPHSLHTRHKMGHLHAFLTTRQKNHQPIKKHKCQSYLQKQQHDCATHQTTTLPSPNPHDMSGIYSLTCNTCKQAYVGQTSRTLQNTSPGTHTLRKKQ
jgi:hypothetical protein